jgi:hypothetical protein
MNQHSTHFSEKKSKLSSQNKGLKYAFIILGFLFNSIAASGQTFYNMSVANYSQNFTNIANTTAWPNGFNGTESQMWRGLAVDASGVIPSALRITTATNGAFTTTTTGGVQRGTGNIQLLTTGATNNTSSAGIELYLDFTGRTAGTLSFNAAQVANSTGDRVGTLRVFASTDGATYSELTATGLPFVATNNVVNTAAISVALPAVFTNSPTARLRFYYHNGTTGGTTGSRPKISIDNVVVTSTPAASTTITLSSPAQTGASNITQSSTNNIISHFQAAVSTANATLNTLAFTTSGTQLAGDLTGNFKLFYGTTNVFTSATQISTVASGAPGTRSFTGLTQAINSGVTGYFWIVADASATSGGNRTLTVSANPVLTFAAGTPTGTITTGGTKTFIDPVSPSLSANTLNAFGSQCVGSTYGPNTFTITGALLTSANVTVSALSGFEFATVAGGPYSASLSLPQPGGAYAQTIHVRFLPIAAVAYNGNIVVGGGGASNINVAASGSGSTGAVAVTTTSATSITSTTAASGGTTLSTTCGSITAKGVVWGSIANPTVPSANSTNDGAGTANFTSNVSGLTPGTTYNYRAYTTNSNGVTSYGANQTFTTLSLEPTAHAASFTVSSPTSSSLTLNFSAASTITNAAGYLIIRRTGAAPTGTPIDATSYSAGNTIGDGTVAAIVSSTAITSTLISGLANASNYHFSLIPFGYNGSNPASYNYFTAATIPNANGTTLSAPITIVTFPSTWSGITTTAPSTFQNANIAGTVTAARAAGLNAVSSSARFNSDNWLSSATLTLAGNTDYITFTVNAASGFVINLAGAALNFTLGSSGTGPINYAVYSSVDGFASTAAQIGANLTTASTSVTFPNTASYNNLTTVEFRIYGFNASAAGGTGGFASMNLTGNLVSIGTITSGTVSTNICAGTTGVSVPFTYTPAVNFPSGSTVFTAQLSNASGSFATPTVLQNVLSNGTGSQSISVNIPSATPSGTGYRIRVVSSSPSATGIDNGSNINIQNSTTSIAPIATQNINPSVNGSALTVSEGATAISRQWSFGTTSGGPYLSNLGIASTQIPNFATPGTYYIVCKSTYGAPCNLTVESNEVQINVTVGLPVLSTTTPTAIDESSAQSGGNVTNDGGAAVTSRGIVWNTSTTPVLPGLGNTALGSGLGTFTSAITALAPQTRYYVRAYATNTAGTGYGNEQNFYTLSNSPEIQAGNLIVNAFSTTQLDLSWDAAQFPATGATTKGYVLLRAVSPTLPTLVSINGQAPLPGAGTTIVSSTIAEFTSTFSNNLLASSTTYNYLLVPFCWDGTNAATYHYLTNLAPEGSGTTLTGSCSEPTNGATSPFTSGNTATQISLTTSTGNGDGRLAVVSTSPITVVPENGIVYNANSQFGLGDNLGSFTYAVYSGSSNVVVVTGLAPSTTYYFAVFEFNSAGQCYKVTAPGTVSSATLSAPSVIETFEPGTKSSYTIGNDVCNLGSWNFSDALIGTDANDRKIGLKSARIRNSGSITMNFDKINGAGTIQVRHGKYGTDANSTWRMDVSTNGGATFDAWSSSVITTSTTTLATQNFAVNLSGAIRIRIVKLSGGSARLNIDNISISDFVSGNSTSTGAIAGSPFCVSDLSGIALNVPYTASGVFGTLNVFTAQLSDANGSFAIPTVIGTLTGNALTGTIPATIPAGTVSGTGYRIRVVTSEPITPLANVSQNSTNLSVFLNAPDVSGFNATTLSGSSVQLAWSLPTGCFDEILVIGRLGSLVNAIPTGNGSLYTANGAFGTIGTNANLPAGNFAVYKAAAGSNVTITGLTAGSTYFFEIFTRKGTNWSDGVILSIEPINTLIGDFRSTATGNWNTAASWQRWNGTAWINCTTLSSPNQWPNQGGTSGSAGTINVTIQSGHTITISTSAASQAINNLTVNAGGKLFTNNSLLNGNRYLTIYGDIKCNGEIGNGSAIYDNISFNVEGNPTSISGTGTFNASRIRKNFSTNATTNLIIAMNVGLRFAAGVGNSSGTQIYSNVSGTVFNMTINENVIVTLNKDVGLSGNISIDGIDGEGSGERGGTFTINGTLNIPGTLFTMTDNLTSAVSYIIGTSGVVNCVSVCTGNTATTGNGSLGGSCTLRILNGGKLNMTDNKPFNLRNNTVSPFTYVEGIGFNNNTFDLQPGSIVQFSSPSGDQPVTSSLTYSNILLTNGANKVITATLNVLQDITMESPSVFIPQGNTINIGGDWRNYNETGFTEGTTSGTVVFNGSNAQNIYCAGGERFYNVTISNSSVSGVTLRNNITLANDLDLGTAGRLFFGPSPTICTLSKMTASSNTFKGSASALVDMSQAEHILLIGCEDPGFTGNLSAGSLSLVNYNRNSLSAVDGNQNILCNLVYANLSLSGSDTKFTNDDFTVNQSFVTDGGNTVIEATVTGKTLTLGGNLTLSGGATMNDNCLDNLEIITSGNASQVFDSQTKNIKCFNLKSTKTSGGLSLLGPLGQTETNIKSDWAIDFSGSALFTDNGNLIKVGDDVELGGTLSTAANFSLSGTLELTGIGASVDVHISDFTSSGAAKAEINHLTINTGALTGGLKTIQNYPIASGASTSIKGDFTILEGSNGAEFETNNNQLLVAGNWTNWDASAFKQGTGNVTFNGASPQNLTCVGGETLYSFTLNNSSTTGVTIIGGDLNVDQQIAFTNGLLNLNSNDLLLGTTTNNALVLGGNTSSYAVVWDGSANGKIIHQVNNNTDAYYFPMGDEVDFSPATVDLNSGLISAARLEGSVIGLPHPQLGSSTNYLNRYWLIEPVGITNPGYNIQFSYATVDAVGPENTLYPAKHNAGGWQTPTGSGSLAQIGTGSVNTGLRTFTWNGLIDFSEFTGLGDGSPLPVELLDFTAEPENEAVLLNWTTASETNNAWFEVERSLDAIHFEIVLKQAGAGNSSLIRNYQDIDKSPFTGVSYYRLKQVDFNGDYSYSQIVPVNFDLNKLALTSAYSGQGNNLIVTFNRAVEEPQFSLFDLSGKLVAVHNETSNGNQFTLPMDVLQKGIYLLDIKVGDLRFISKVIY